MNAVVEALRGTERDTGLKFEELDELSRYYGKDRKVYAAFESDMKAPNAEIYKYRSRAVSIPTFLLRLQAWVPR